MMTHYHKSISSKNHFPFEKVILNKSLSNALMSRAKILILRQKVKKLSPWAYGRNSPLLSWTPCTYVITIYLYVYSGLQRNSSFGHFTLWNGYFLQRILTSKCRATPMTAWLQIKGDWRFPKRCSTSL